LATRWLGEGASEMGLEGAVERKALKLLLEGRDPSTGERLGASFRRHACYSAVLAAPKPVSVAFALTANPSLYSLIWEAHHDAVEAAARFLEAATTVTNSTLHGRRCLAPAAGFVAASFTHLLNRRNEPHLHTHLVIPNLARRRDGRWLCLNPALMRETAGDAGRVYRGHLIARLSRELYVRCDRDLRGISLGQLGPDQAAALAQLAAPLAPVRNAAPGGPSAHLASRLPLIALPDPQASSLVERLVAADAPALRGDHSEPARDVWPVICSLRNPSHEYDYGLWLDRPRRLQRVKEMAIEGPELGL
jgi:hypothetical protein